MNETEYKELINEIRLLGVELRNIRVLLEKSLEEPKKTGGRAYKGTIVELVFDKLDDAVDVLNDLKGLEKRYGVVSVRDYYELCGVNSDYEDTKYGWTSFDRAYIKQYGRTGYCIVLNKPLPID